MEVRAAPHLHRAAPLAPWLRENQGASPPPSEAALELMMSEHDVARPDLDGFYAAHTAPPDAAWPTWDTPLDGDELERALSDVREMLAAFDDAPPVTLQRLAELLVRPTAQYHTRAKYLRALRRVLSVTSGAQPDEPADAQEGPAPEAATTTFRLRPTSDAVPMYTPLPEAAGGADEAPPSDAGAKAEAASPRIESRATPPPAPAKDAADTVQVPEGRVDELDSPTEHGSLTKDVQPLTSTTSLHDTDKKRRTE